MTEAVSLRHVSKRYGSVTALDGLTLGVNEGEVLGLLGHNGAGKTTTMKLILGLITPSTGQVQVFARDPHGRDATQLRFQIGFLPEHVSFYEQLSGREILVYFARLKRLNTGCLHDLLERVGLAAAADRRARTYSKGMRQRLGLAQALLGNPRLLLLDEPTIGLDPVATRDFFQMLDALRGAGVTILLSSHALPGIETHIDRAAILGHGRLLALGNLDSLRAQAALPFTLRVRGRWDAADWEKTLRNKGLAVKRVNGACIDLITPLTDKMDVIRLVVAEPRVEDIEVRPPTLEDLYVHFSRTDVIQGIS